MRRRAPSAELPPHPWALAEEPWRTSWCGCRCRNPRWLAHTPPSSSVSSRSAPLQEFMQQSRHAHISHATPCHVHHASTGPNQAGRWQKEAPGPGFCPTAILPAMHPAGDPKSERRCCKSTLMQLSCRRECFGLSKMLSKQAAYPAGTQTPPAAQLS